MLNERVHKLLFLWHTQIRFSIFITTPSPFTNKFSNRLNMFKYSMFVGIEVYGECSLITIGSSIYEV